MIIGNDFCNRTKGTGADTNSTNSRERATSDALKALRILARGCLAPPHICEATPGKTPPKNLLSFAGHHWHRAGRGLHYGARLCRRPAAAICTRLRLTLCAQPRSGGIKLGRYPGRHNKIRPALLQKTHFWG